MPHDRELTEAICSLACAVRGLGEQLVNENKMILSRIEQKVDDLMSALSDWSAKVGPKLDRVQSGLDTVQALVEKLQNSPGAITPEDQALLDQIEAKIDAIATDADSVPATPPVV